MQSASLKKAELACRHLELGAKESTERAAQAKAKRDAARHEASMAKLEIEGAVNTQARVESELTRVQRVVAVAEGARMKAKSKREDAQKALSLAREACTKAKEENSRLTDERLSLILELGTFKYDFVALQEKVVVDREVMRPSLMRAVTRCSTMAMVAVFLHTIYSGASLRSPLTSEFFANPRCPTSTLSAIPAPDPATVSREERPESSPTVVGEEKTLPMGLLAPSDGEVKDAAPN